ncbi:MAG: hypothetical protein MJZ05_11050 [Fibrobacter sp.]|nr:hypothetical protein [Fibrobacter sp.]
MLPLNSIQDVGRHEKDHHAVTSAKQAIFFDAAHHENPGLLSKQRKILRNYVDDLNDLNEYMETTDWLGQTSLGKYIIKKRLNHEPQIRLKILRQRFLVWILWKFTNF